MKMKSVKIKIKMSQYSRIWSCCFPRRLFPGWCITSRFPYAVWQGRGTKKFEQLKFLSLKIQEVTSKSVAVTERNERNYVRHTNQGHLPTKVTPVIGLTDEPVIQCDVPVIENNFVDDCK